LPHSFTSAGLLNEKLPVPAAFFHGQDGLIIVFAFHDGTEIGPRMLARIAKKTGLQPADL
jgi:hypothetical protein